MWGVFHVPKARMLFVTGTKGGGEHKKAWGWNTTIFLKLFCFLVFVSLQSASRLPLVAGRRKPIARAVAVGEIWDLLLR